jgi:polyhydroxybutyrate depolymerase
VSLLLIWGSADRLNPPGGGDVRRGGRSYVRPSGEASWRRWGELLGCPAESPQVQTAPKVLKRSFVRCAGGSEATFVTVDGLGHQWPGGPTVLRIIAGPGSDALNATDAIWSFFEAHQR